MILWDKITTCHDCRKFLWEAINGVMGDNLVPATLVSYRLVLGDVGIYGQHNSSFRYACSVFSGENSIEHTGSLGKVGSCSHVDVSLVRGRV